MYKTRYINNVELYNYYDIPKTHPDSDEPTYIVADYFIKNSEILKSYTISH